MNKIITQSTEKPAKDSDAKLKKPQKAEPRKNVFKEFFTSVSDFFIFSMRFFAEAFKLPVEFNELMRQSYIIGYKSFPLVGITGFIIGLVLTIQSRPTLAEFGAESWLPAMISVSLIREISPVITALICAGKIGSGIGAELASMKVTEQIDAMEVSGINPFKYLVVTRVLSTAIMLPILTVFSNLIGMYGSFVGVNIKGEVTYQLFMAQSLSSLQFSDLISSVLKTVFFGLAIGLIATFQGYNSNKGTEGVGAAANSSVVHASLMVFIIDVIAVQISSLFL
jgi:phospholipid/cholesterol/gamma-HCH transport system permease protein